jgi:hypothetical protein
MIIQTFFKEKPSLNSPYRQLEFERDIDGRLQLQLIAGERAGREHAKVLRIEYVKTFDEGLERYSEWFRELDKEGWRPYAAS